MNKRANGNVFKRQAVRGINGKLFLARNNAIAHFKVLGRKYISAPAGRINDSGDKGGSRRIVLYRFHPRLNVKIVLNKINQAVAALGAAAAVTNGDSTALAPAAGFFYGF